MKKYLNTHAVMFAALILFTVFAQTALADEKLTAEQIVAKHLDSIGTAEKRKSITNQIILCSVQFTQAGSTTILGGNSVFASAGPKNLVGMLFNSNDYPQEKFSFDGDKSRVAFTKPGVYSILGDFLFNNKGMIKDGMLGGALFSSWALNDVSGRQAKISAAGTKKLGSMETYVVEFVPKGGFDLEVKMFFDKKTFQHVRTEYSKIIAARQASTIDASAGQSSDRISLVEEFSAFQKMDGLNLPGEYSLSYTYYNNSPIQASNKRNVDLRWKFKVNSFSFNQQLDANSFDIETN